MKAQISKPLIVLIARLALAGIFVTAAVNKILDPEAFAVSVTSYRVLPQAVSPWVALCLPWLELVAGFGLLVRPIQRASGAIISSLLLIFIILNMAAWSRGLDVNCGCFGADEGTTNYIWLLLRNSFLLLVSAGLTWESFRKSPAHLPS